MHYPDIGLDLFTAPFGDTSAAAPKRETPKPQPQQTKTMARQQEKATVTQPEVPVSSRLPEEKRTEPSLQHSHTEIKAPEPAQPHPAEKDSESAQPHPAAKASESTRLQTDKTDSESTHLEVKDSEPAQPQTPVKDSESTQPQAQPEPPKELSLDMSDHSIPAGKPLDSSEDAKRKAHEEAEAKRKAEWEAKQAAKKKAEEEAIQKLESMSDDDIIAASTERVSKDTERLTRRNMKECVAEHIQNLCRKDPAFARKTMHPKKSMINCFHYINRMAKEYIRKEMEDNDIKPENGIYGSDVPNNLCYHWAEKYFMDALEDKGDEEKFVPRPYVSTASKSTKTSKTKKAAKKEPKKKQEPKKNDYQQMSLPGVN